MSSTKNNLPPEKKLDQLEKDETTTKEWPFLALKGFLMGSADIVPGVSGGTMALITGIYERLLSAIKSVNASSLKALVSLKFKLFFELFHWKFLVGLFAGILSAVVFFTKIVPLQVYMFTQPEMVYGLFFGLILGSIWILAKAIPKWSVAEAVSLIMGTVIGFWIVNLVPAETPENAAFVFLSGMIAICAMILPGISGSYLLLMLRKYEYVLSRISELGGDNTVQAFLDLVPFGLGAVAGIMLFSRFLSWFLAKYHNKTMALLIGFLLGSLYVIWPYQEREYARINKVEILQASPELRQAFTAQKLDTLKPKFSYLKKLNDGRFERVEVKKKQLSVTPYNPINQQIRGENGILLVKGLGGIFLGLVLVVGIDKLRSSKSMNSK
jgi:putative membrane protein